MGAPYKHPLEIAKGFTKIVYKYAKGVFISKLTANKQTNI